MFYCCLCGGDDRLLLIFSLSLKGSFWPRFFFLGCSSRSRSCYGSCRLFTYFTYLALPRGTCSDGEDASLLAIRSNRWSVSQSAWVWYQKSRLIARLRLLDAERRQWRTWLRRCSALAAFAEELVSPWSEPPLLLWTHGDLLTDVRVGILNHALCALH